MALDVLCIGETLVDFLPERAGQAVRDVELWRRCTGGSPANVAVGLARLGASSAMLGVVGQDAFGDFLRRSLERDGVDVSRLRQTREGKTGLVFISLDERGDRSFAMFRTRSAELFLGAQDVDLEAARTARAVHFGTNSLLFEDAQRAMQTMVEAAHAAGRIVSADPNLRLHFWPDPSVLRGAIDRLTPHCTVVKLAEDEIGFAVDTTDPHEALRRLATRGVPLPVVTLGERGAVALFRGQVLDVSAVKAHVVDTTGAGDGFVAAMLYALTRLCATRAEVEALEVQVVRDILTFGCAVAARVIEHFGAVTSLPRLDEVADALPAALRR